MYVEENTLIIECVDVAAESFEPGDATRYDLVLTPIPLTRTRYVLSWLNAHGGGRSMSLLSPGLSGELTPEYVAEKLGVDLDRERPALVAILTWLSKHKFQVWLGPEDEAVKSRWK